MYNKLSIKNLKKGFTLAESATHANMLQRVGNGFTLAEVLIILAIIGVVAAMTIPTLIAKINDKIKTSRITNIEAKLKQGTDKLMILGQINGYSSTEDFVKALSQHYKITNYCSGSGIGNCFPYKKINIEGRNGVVEISDLTTPEKFGLKSSEYGNPVSFVTADGIPYIILYKKNCAIDDGDVRSNSTACISGIFDWNGASKPNKIVSQTNSKTNFYNSDIQLLGDANQIAGYYAIQYDGPLVPAIGDNTVFKYIGSNYLDENGKGLNTCGMSGNGMAGNVMSYCTDNKWYAAFQKCESMGMHLPTRDELMQLYCQAKGPEATFTRYLSGSCKSKYSNITEINSALRDKVKNTRQFWASNGAFYYASDAMTYIVFNIGVIGWADVAAVNVATVAAICIGK